jgi:hypothetical protein
MSTTRRECLRAETLPFRPFGGLGGSRAGTAWAVTVCQTLLPCHTPGDT